jgi:copper chaperone
MIFMTTFLHGQRGHDASAPMTKRDNPAMHKFVLPDMSCGHCIAAITAALQAVDAEARIAIDREARQADVDSVLPRATLAAALAEAGYPPADDTTRV